MISGTPPEYGWSARAVTAIDGLLLAGPHRNLPRHLFALGRTPHSATGAFVAARLLTRALLGRSEKGDDVFAWTR